MPRRRDPLELVTCSICRKEVVRIRAFKHKGAWICKKHFPDRRGDDLGQRADEKPGLPAGYQRVRYADGSGWFFRRASNAHH
jgi:hypothetical protein